MKSEIRKEALEKRKTLNCKELSSKILCNLFSTEEFKKSKHIIGYYPLEYEVNIRTCFEDKSKNWFLPRVNGDMLEICPYEKLSKGHFGIMEPDGNAIYDFSKIDLVIIPACAVDMNGYRLGWGKGYYDRFLPLLPNSCIKIIPVFSELIYTSIFPDKFDIKGDIIISDKEILRI